MAVGTVLALAGWSGASPDSAFGCVAVTNPDGSKTCTETYSDVPCPATTGVPGQIVAYAYHGIPKGATDVTHSLTFMPTPHCNNATLTQSFNPNASGPNPDASTPTVGANEQVARVIYTTTCNMMPCGPANPTTTFAVTYRDPLRAPRASDVDFDKLAESSKKDLEVVAQMGEELASGGPMDLTDLVIYTASGVKPKKFAAPAAKRRVAGRAPNVSAPIGTRSVTLRFRLKKAAKAALASAGKLQVTIEGRISNTAGSATFSAKVKVKPAKAGKKK